MLVYMCTRYSMWVEHTPACLVRWVYRRLAPIVCMQWPHHSENPIRVWGDHQRICGWSCKLSINMSATSRTAHCQDVTMTDQLQSTSRSWVHVHVWCPNP